MPQFILKIDLGTNTMCTEPHITRTLKKIAYEIESIGMLYCQSYPIHDLEGNVVGHYEVVDS